MINLSLLQNLSSASVLVVGDVMLDRYFNGDSQRISPEAPVPVVKISKIEDKAGGAANVARNIAHLDGKVGLLGIIGNDSAGESLQQLLAGEQIHSELFSQDHKPTIAKMRVVSRQQQIVRLDQEEMFSSQDAELLAERFAAVYQNYDVILFSDYNKGSLQQISKMIKLAKAAGKTVLVDPKQADLSVYAGADVITPNLGEFKTAGGKTASVEEMLSSARELMQKAGLASILLTRSENGMSLITATEHHHFPAQVLEVSDVTGAGDTVIATLAVMLSAGMSLHDATQLANLAAGIVVGKVGAATVSPEELAAKLNKDLFRQGDFYQTPFDKVLQHIQFARQNGERIVFTNGCFDILHAGHVRYLAQAKALGDRLVVGLNSDASVRRLKGEQRPINTLEDRATVLASLASVDWVVPFGDDLAENDTPLKLISTILPDVLVKGGDYSIETIVGADVVIAHGGEVQVLTFVDGRSTSKVIRKIQDLQEITDLSQPIKSICILRLSAIGDVCNAVSVVQAIQRQHPQAQITWIIGKIEARLLEGLPGVRFVVFDKKLGKAAYSQLKQDLKHDYFDVLLHMQVAFRANVASLCIKARKKIGFDWHTAKELHALFMRHRIEPAPRSHVLDGFRQFAKAIGVTELQLGTTPTWQLPIPEVDELWAKQQLAAIGNSRVLIISPAASKAERNWLPERYAALADYAHTKGFAVVLCGGPTELERNLSQAILASAQHPITDLTGKTNLKQLLALLKHASVVLAPDTGPAHMAVAVGTPVIGLYGHSNPDRTGPYLFRQYVVEVYHQSLLEQQGKTAAELKWGTRVKGSDIMQKIAVEDVTAMFDKVVTEQQL